VRFRERIVSIPEPWPHLSIVIYLDRADEWRSLEPAARAGRRLQPSRRNIHIRT